VISFHIVSTPVDKIEWRNYPNALLFSNFETYQIPPAGMKYTQTTLDKIERVLDEAEYIVRYERGTFQSGYCILEERKVVVLNKFLQMEGRINTLIDIIPQLKMHPEMLTPEARRVYDDVLSAHHVNEG
jgi:hypothetical protein